MAENKCVQARIVLVGNFASLNFSDTLGLTSYPFFKGAHAMDSRHKLHHKGIEVGFEVKDKWEAHKSRPTRAFDFDESDIDLTFTMTFDKNNQEIMKIVDYIFKDTGYGYRNGLMSIIQRYVKFNIEIDYTIGNDQYKFKDGDDDNISSLSITFPLPKLNSDYLLQTLSMFEDTIYYFKKNNAAIHFNILDIMIRIYEEYKKAKLDDCMCATTLSNLIYMIKHNHMLEHHDAILLSYCFSHLESLDSSALYFQPDDTKMLSSVVNKIIDDVFKVKFITVNDSTASSENSEDSDTNKYHHKLNEFLRRLNLCQRIRLFRPALYNKADDGGLYQWRYTEWDKFLQFVKIRLDNRGNVYLDVADSKKDPESGYSTFYAAGKEHHKDFEREMKALAPYIGLSFQSDINFHDKILFTQECSKKLFDMKLYLDVDSMKKIVKAKNTYRFFQEACKSGDFHVALQEHTLIEEIVKMIISIIHESPMCSPAELDSPVAINRLLGS